MGLDKGGVMSDPFFALADANLRFVSSLSSLQMVANTFRWSQPKDSSRSSNARVL